MGKQKEYEQQIGAIVADLMSRHNFGEPQLQDLFGALGRLGDRGIFPNDLIRMEQILAHRESALEKLSYENEELSELSDRYHQRYETLLKTLRETVEYCEQLRKEGGQGTRNKVYEAIRKLGKVADES
jgi:hypothetical protein